MREKLRQFIDQIPGIIGRAMDKKGSIDPNVDPNNLLDRSRFYSVDGRPPKSPLELSRFSNKPDDSDIAEGDQLPTGIPLTLEE